MEKKPDRFVPLPDEETSKEKKRKKLPSLPTSQMGGTLGTLMSVFRQEYPTVGSRQGTYENLKRCRYIRRYEIMSEEEREEARKAKTSSWDPDALKA